MKKILTLCLICSLSSTLLAQINLGLKGGMNYNFTQIESSLNASEISNAASWCGGAFVRLKLDKFHVMGEGLFTGHQGGLKLASSQEEKINFYTVDVPLLLGYKVIDLKVVKFRLNAGIVPSFTVLKLGDLEKADYQDSYVSVAGGLSVDIPLFLFELRYQGGLGTYYEVQNSLNDTRVTNNMLTLTMGWKII